MSHTPGPWRPTMESLHAPQQVCSEAGYEICTVYGDGKHTREANARLIAAAPEQHDLLKGIAMALDEWDHYDDDERAEWVRLVQPQIAATIAKGEAE